MPLLEAEPRAFPETLFADPTFADPAAGRWWVLYTKARMEKSVARQLHGRGVTFYLPQYQQTWKARGRTRSSFLPLFPGYVFLHGDEDARVAALETNLLSSILPVPDQRRLFDDLARVERVLGGSAPVLPEPTLPAGTRVEIVAGSFQGLRGTVVRRGDETRVVVEVEFLRRGVSVEVEAWAVQPLSAAAPAVARGGI